MNDTAQNFQHDFDKPSDILAQCTVINPPDEAYLKHSVIERFGRPEQLIYVDQTDVDINGVIYEQPLIMPIVNGQLELIQCAVMQDGQPVSVIPDGLAQGFACYGDIQKDKPVIITHSLESFFKVSQTGYAVALVVLPTLCSRHQAELKAFDFEQIQFVINQLSKAGYKQLYLPVTIEQISLEPFKALEQNTAVRLLSDYLEIGVSEFQIELTQYEKLTEVQAFFDLAIEALPEKSILPKGHLAKPFKMDDSSFLHIMDSGLYLIKEKRDENGELEQARTFISQSAIVLGEARSLNNDNWKRVIRFHDKDNTQHTLLIPYEHFMGEAQEALKIIANHGLMPPRHSNKKNVFINYIQDYPIEKRFRSVERAGWYGNSFVTTNRTYGNGTDEELLFHSDMKDPHSTLGSFEGWQELSRLIEPHSLAVLAFSCAFSGQLVTPLAIESGGFHIYGTSTDGKSTITKASCSIWGRPKGVQSIKERPLSTSTAIEICQTIKGVDLDIRATTGTALKNSYTNEVIYTPPVGQDAIRNLLSNLDHFLHYNDELDPLIKMAIAHYQFEAIHPFIDGNGRTGRILNILYLMDCQLLTLPILYLSRFIIMNNAKYYELLLSVTTQGNWQEWILFILQAVKNTSEWTIAKIKSIRQLQEHTIEYVKSDAQKIYSRELVDIIFEQPYSRISNLVDRDIAKRQSASTYLKKLVEIGVLEEINIGKEKLFLHPKLLQLLTSDNNSFTSYR